MVATLNSHGITVSLVSHGHQEPVAELVAEILAQPLVTRVVLTLNVPQTLELPDSDRLFIIANDTPKGFGANHNQAFLQCRDAYFLVLNPDVELTPGLFASLITCQQTTGAAVVAPAVFARNATREDSWRRFPTLWSLVLKACGHDQSMLNPCSDICYPDWVAGMCMLFEARAFKQLGGFDQRYYLYYEDVDICARAWLRGLTVAGCAQARLVHDGQRASRRDWQHLRWHIASMVRYLWQYRGALKVLTKPGSDPHRGH